jgi:3'-5' exoribonuclease
MAKAQYLADLRVGDYVDTIAVVKSKRLIPYRTRPGYYLVLILKDRTGAIEGRVWDDAERIDREIGDRKVVRVRGIVELYQQVPQVRIVNVEPAAEGEYDWTDLVPRTERDVAAMWQRVRDAIDSVSNPYLQRLLREFFDDPEFADAFQNAPASLYLHHSWVGGLLEHICTVLDLAEALCQHYPELDRDLLITGVLLHDIGKVREYTWQVDIDRTPEPLPVTELPTELPPVPSELEMPPSELEPLVAEVPELPTELPEEPPSLLREPTEPEEPVRRRRTRRVEPPEEEEGRLPL